MEARALRFHGVGDLRDEYVELNPLDAGEVLIGVEACGVCGSDYHFLDGSARTGQLPVTLGHEIAGVVISSRDRFWEPGDEVVVAAGVTCGECRMCSDDREDLCERLLMTGIDFDGGLASHVIVPSTALMARPSNLIPEVAATAVDAGATAYHAAVCKAGVRDGDSVLVIGAGGLGSFAIQIAKSKGAAPVIAADRDEAALDRAERLGADEVILVEAGTSVGRTAKLMTNGGVDVALEFVGRAATVDAAVKSLRPGSAAIVAGIGREPLVTLPPVLWATNEYALVGSFGSHRRDAEKVLALLADGSLETPSIETVPADSALDRILAAASGQSLPQGRLIVHFGS
ncbi:MAG: zinc-binding dehydrogenase [Acidimicrobiia bacterium]